MAGAFIQLKLCGFVVDLPACLASNVHDFQAVSHIMGPAINDHNCNTDTVWLVWNMCLVWNKHGIVGEVVRR